MIRKLIVSDDFKEKHFFIFFIFKNSSLAGKRKLTILQAIEIGISVQIPCL